MKKFAKLLLIVFSLSMVLALATGCGCEHIVDAEGFCTECGGTVKNTEGVIYKVSSNGKSAEVVGYNGDSSKVRIADVYNGVPVTTIGKKAFYDSTVEQVTISNSVKTIEYCAFMYCMELKTISFGNGLTKIGDGAFSSCTKLTSVTIPDSVTTIGGTAFSGCSNLSSVKIGSGVTVVDEYAFWYCTSLKSVTLPEGVTTIGRYAFSNCTELTNLTIPSTIKSIDYSAFEDSSNIKFNKKDGLNYLGNSKNAYLVLVEAADKSITDCQISNQTKIINASAFEDCTALKTVTIPSSVVQVGQGAFRNCSALTRAFVPSSVTNMGIFAFKGCSSVTIYCEASKQPIGWPITWNSPESGSYAPVVWGAKN